jgi:hypothetical protein
MITIQQDIDFLETSAGASREVEINCTGANLGDPVVLGVGFDFTNTLFVARVSAIDKITVKFYNHSSAAIDPPSGPFKICIVKF